MISRTTIWRANQLHHTHHIPLSPSTCSSAKAMGPTHSSSLTVYLNVRVSEPGGIRTLDLRLRRPLLYPAELQTHTASSLELSSSKPCSCSLSVSRERVMGIEPTYLAWKASVLPLNYTRTVIGVTGFEPATSWSQTRRSSQAEPHPVTL